MFGEYMIACCGLNCSACSAAHGENPCRGCGSPDGCKPEFCRAICGIKLCEKRIRNKYRFCDECPDYPCEVTKANDHRCRTEYASGESPFENLKKIRKYGLDEFLHEERAKWTCVECGGIIRAQDGVCTGCGRQYTF